MRRSSVMLAVMLAGFGFASKPAVAQDSWPGNGPAFASDQQQRTAEEEAERAARRKTYEPVVYPQYMEGGERPDIQPAAPPVVYLDRPEEPGSIIVDTANRKLYYILPGKKAFAYPISVGREGFTWSGTQKISRIAEWPSWTPPPEMRARIPGLPITVSGGLKNPQGARALYLGSTVYRIHGTNNERTVGRANSSGCFRLSNENVVHLASIAKVGTTVKVLPSYQGNVSENAPLSSIFDFLSPNANAEPAPKAKPKKAAQQKKPAAKAAADVVNPAPSSPAQAARKPAVATAETAAQPAKAAAPSATDAKAGDAKATAQAAAEEARTAAAEALAAAKAAREATNAAKLAVQ